MNGIIIAGWKGSQTGAKIEVLYAGHDGLEADKVAEEARKGGFISLKRLGPSLSGVPLPTSPILTVASGKPKVAERKPAELPKVQPPPAHIQAREDALVKARAERLKIQPQVAPKATPSETETEVEVEEDVAKEDGTTEKKKVKRKVKRPSKDQN